MQLSELKAMINEGNFNSYDVDVPLECIKSGIRFSNIDDFFKFAQSQGVEDIFCCYYYEDESDCLITEQVIEDIGLQYDVLKIIEDDIKKFNESVKALDFCVPRSVILTFPFNGVYCVLWFEDENIYTDPKAALGNILEEHQESINKSREQKKKEIVLLKKELGNKIKNDSAFLKCTNGRLRHLYMQDLIKERLDSHFSPLKEYWTSAAPVGIYQDAFDFAEILWREIKEK